MSVTLDDIDLPRLTPTDADALATLKEALPGGWNVVVEGMDGARMDGACAA